MNNVIATVGIRVDTKQLDELNRKLDEINRKTRDMGGEFSGVEKESSKTTKKMGDDWTKFGKKMGTAIGVGIGVVLGTIVHGALELERTLVNLNSTLDATGNAAGFSSAELLKLSKELSAASTFSTADILDMQANMLSYTTIVGENYTQAVQLAIDYTARFGGSLQANSDAIGKALQNPIKAMGDLVQKGFELDTATRKLITAHLEYGREAEAQAVILEWVGEATEGAALAQTNTLWGALVGTVNRLKDLADQSEDGTHKILGTTKALNQFNGGLANTESRTAKAGRALFALGDYAISGPIEAFNDFVGALNAFDGAINYTVKQTEDALERLNKRIDESTTETAGYNRMLERRIELENHLNSLLNERQRKLVERGVAAAIAFSTGGSGASDELLQWAEGFEQATEQIGKTRVQLIELERERKIAEAGMDTDTMRRAANIQVINDQYDARVRAVQASEAEAASLRRSTTARDDAKRAAEQYAEALKRMRSDLTDNTDAIIRDINNTNTLAYLHQDLQMAVIGSVRGISNETVKTVRDNLDYLQTSIDLLQRIGIEASIVKETLDTPDGIPASTFKLSYDVEGFLKDTLPDFDNRPLEERNALIAEMEQRVDAIVEKEKGLAAASVENNQILRSRNAELAYMEQYTVSTRINDETIDAVKKGQLRTTEQITNFMRQQEFIERLRIQAARDGVVLDEERLRLMREEYELSNKRLADAQKQISQTEQMAKDIGNIFSNSILDGLNQGRMDFKSFMYDIGQYLLRSGINEIFASLFNPSSAGNSGAWGNVLGAIIGVFTGGRFAGAGKVGAETVGTISTGANFANYAAKGAFSDGQGNWEFMSKGGILNRRTEFSTNSGRAVAGEAAPEGVLPLARTPDGKLGVHSIGGGGSNEPASVGISQSNQFNITVQNSDNPARDDMEAAKAIADVARAVFSQEMDRAQRPGGRLARQIQRYG